MMRQTNSVGQVGCGAESPCLAKVPASFVEDKAVAKPESDLSIQLTRIRKELSLYDQILKDLQSLLAPVMIDEKPEPAKEEKEMQCKTDLSEEVRWLAAALSELNARAHRIIDRIDL